VKTYVDEVRDRTFPAAEHVYGMRREDGAPDAQGVTKKPKITRR
jgi:hypothetical protein